MLAIPKFVYVLSWIWPFASGWMLLFALAAAIPILIHLWNRRRYKVVTWAAMEYLLAAIRRRSRRITIEQLILLALRVLILLMLAAALADPFWPGRSPLGGGLSTSGQTHWVVVLDGSFSMDYRREGKNRFELAKELAVQLVDESTQGDGFTLVLMSDPPQVIVREPAFDREDVREEIRNLQLPHGGANLSATLADVEKIVRAASEKHPRLASTKVCMFTDLGRTTWDEIASADCRTRVGRLGEVASLVLLDLGDPGSQNLAVTQLEAEQSLLTAGRDVSFRAEIQNFGAQPRAAFPVEFIVDGQTVHEQRVDVTPLGRATATMVHRFSVPGEHYVEVRAGDDPLPIDNNRWMSLPVRESIRVMCVEGKTGSARHVALALSPTKSASPRVRVDTAFENAIVESDLNDYDCIVLCNVGRFGPDEAVVLHDYLRDGGGLVFFLGDQVQAENYNRELGGERTKRRVLPARLEQTVAEAQYQFDPRDYRHPIVAPFRGHTQAGLLTTPVWKYFKVTPFDPATAKVALAFEGTGDAAIVEEQIGLGRSIIYASAASGESVDQTPAGPSSWTAIHTWPSFPPLVQEILMLAVSGRTAGRNVQVGDDLEGAVHGIVTDIPLVVGTPDGTTERVKTTIDGGDRRWMYDGVSRSGLYEARFGPPISTTQIFAANVNTRESDLERFDPELLPSQFSQDYKVDDTATANLPISDRSQVYQWVLVALMMFLFLETILAWAFGRASG